MGYVVLHKPHALVLASFLNLVDEFGQVEVAGEPGLGMPAEWADSRQFEWVES